MSRTDFARAFSLVPFRARVAIQGAMQHWITVVDHKANKGELPARARCSARRSRTRRATPTRCGSAPRSATGWARCLSAT